MVIADLHIHSRYSRATSRDCVPESLDFWARRKGIGLLGTGDFTHPAWREELKEKLEPAGDAEPGLYRLKREYRRPDSVPDCLSPRFVLTGEISSIYKKNGRVRKIHSLILLPGLEAAEEVSRRLEAVGNLHSDGRPILGLDARDLLELTLDACPSAVLIPAHIWTPHFSLFGAFSGFDTLEECFEDLSPHIHALETGLSSDPPMNWRLSALDSYLLVSNSDAHSPQKLGREANLLDFRGDPSYPGLARALDGRDQAGFLGTLEFFPEEGKYHYDGHRACGQCLKPEETRQADGICPCCGKKITIGVLHRVEQLADREEGFLPETRKPFESLVPLHEVVAASTGRSAASVRTAAACEELLRKLGPEFTILREMPLEDIRRVGGPCVAEGIRRVRAGEIQTVPGYDGEYGKIEILDEKEISALTGQTSLFEGSSLSSRSKKKADRSEPASSQEPETGGQAGEVQGTPAPSRKRKIETGTPEGAALKKPEGPLSELNQEQRRAVGSPASVNLVIAGPGTGKTKTLVSRIAFLLEQNIAAPEDITAVTFTRQAASEIQERLPSMLGAKWKNELLKMRVGTFHSLCLQDLSRERPELVLMDEWEALDLAGEVLEEAAASFKSPRKLPPRRLLEWISRKHNGLEDPAGEGDAAFFAFCWELYRKKQREYHSMDYDTLLLEALALLEENPPSAAGRHLLVDEFQDVSPVQYRLVRAWSGSGGNLFAIGDPDQSIYGFRGSEARCFERLLEDYPEAQTVRLTQNYRSSPEILRGARALILSGSAGSPELEAVRESGPPVRLLETADEFSAGVFVAKEINRMAGGVDMLDTDTLNIRREKKGAIGFSDVAVLYRTHRQARLLEKCLIKEGIPYVVHGRDSLLSDPLVRGMTGFFRFLVHPGDWASLRACLSCLWNIPSCLVRELQKELEEQAKSAGQEGNKAFSWLSRLSPRFQSERGVMAWAELSEEFFPRADRETPRLLLEALASELGQEGNPVLEKLCNMALFYEKMRDFLYHLTLGREGDVIRSGTRKYFPDAVSLMTLHGSKGLEFPVVFLCGAQKGMIPLEAPLSHRSAGEPEEERRLLYVGMTRAREELLLLYSQELSPFLKELPGELWAAGSPRELRPLKEEKQLSFF